MSGSDKVLVFPRAVPGNAEKPVVLHLLNQDYDGQGDVMRPPQKFTIRLRRDLFPERQFTTATLHAPSPQSVRLDMRVDTAHIEIDVPELSLWGLIELR